MNENFKIKGYDSYDAGNFLKEKHPNSSIHCYHYCCVQFIEQIFLDYDIDFKSETNDYSHEQRITKFISFVGMKFGNIALLNSALTKIRKTRNEADYNNIPLKSKSDSTEIQQQCDVFMSYLKTNNLI